MKNSIQVPEELAPLSEEDLSALATEIREAAEELGADAANDDEALIAIEALVADFNRIDEELSSREAAKTARADRAAAALGALAGDTVTDEVAPVEGEADEVAPLAAQVEDAETLAVEAPAEAAVVVEAPAEAVVAEVPAETVVVEAPVEALAVETPVEASIEAPVEAPAATTVATSEDAVSESISTSTVAALDADLPDAMTVRSDDAKGAGLTASNAVSGLNEGATMSTAALAKAIVDKRVGFGRASAGTHERIVLASSVVNYGHQVGGSEEANFQVLEDVRKEWAASRKAETSLVASGGVCAPLEPSYDFFRLAEPLNPVEGSLPVVAAPRGGIRFITPPDYRDASGGVRVTTEAEDADGYTTQDPAGGTEPKPCVSVVCPPVEECRVDAVSQCVTFGNLNYRVFPEQVEAFLADLAVIFTQVKEVFYLDAIDAASTAVTFAPAYSAARGITYTLLAAGANYRRRHHMSADATLTLHLPSWVTEFLKVDLVNDHSLGLNFLGASDAQVAQVFAGFNLDVNFYYDSATGAGQAFAGAQGAGALNEFPSSVVAYLYAPGTFVRLNAGTLDLGVVRDSVLNGTNDLQIFSEEWIQVCQVGLESLRLEIALCPDGTAPEPVVPLDCAAVSG